MAKKQSDLLSTLSFIKIGDTPLVYLQKYEIFVKLERSNPTGSIKDRAAYFMLFQAIKEGKITRHTTIVEPTSGNTGISLAWLATQLGLKAILTMPKAASIERIKLLQGLGARVILTDTIEEAVEKAKAISENKDFFMPNQFENERNVLAHFSTTGPEILKQMDYQLDAFVAGVGSGGTITGVGKFLKEFNPTIKIIAVEPKQSAILSGGSPGKHKIQGIGAGFKPKILDLKLIDEIIQIDDSEALGWTVKLWKEGIFAGISSSANLLASLKIKEKYKFKRIVTVFPDDGYKYLSQILGNS
ncbi:MAG: cysteine synthase family protein [bacterium]|nr:cysteine synthase family protein [bacterium]